jgi:virginiamycin B lyase
MRFRVTPLFVCGCLLLVGNAHATSKSWICDAFATPSSGVRGNLLVGVPGESVWFTDFNTNRLIRVDKNRKVSPIVLGDAATRPLTGLALGADGQVWYSKLSDRIGRVPANGGEGVEYELPKSTGPASITLGPDGNLWFISKTKNLIGRFTPAGDVTTYDVPKMGGSAVGGAGAAIGPDGALWITSTGRNAVYRFDFGTQEFRRFDIASPRAQPDEIIAGPDGNLWVTLRAARKILRLTTGGASTELELGDATPVGIASGPDDAVWVSASNGSLIRIEPTSGAMSRHGCEIAPSAMTIGPDGRLWVLGNGRVAIVRERENATKARVAAVTTVPAPSIAPPGLRGATVEVISADLLADRVRTAAAPVIVQFSSADPNCTYCIPANARYDELARTAPAETTMLRVYFEPWASVSQSVSAGLFGITALPTVARYENGRESARVQGDYSADRLAQQLGLN